MPEYVSHIVLLPQGAEWKWYEAVCRYVEKYRVTVTQSADDAGSFHGFSHTITVADAPGAWPGDIVAWLRDNYPDARLDVVRVSGPAQLAVVLNERVETDDRYGDRQMWLDWPVRREPLITQRFAARPWAYRPYGNLGHEGMDFAAAEGVPVVACADGRVSFVDTGHPDDPAGYPYGNQVHIEHRRGSDLYHTLYAHLSTVQVQRGQEVRRGEIIGLAGSTGNITGPHLHLALKKQGAQTVGFPAGIVDPEFYLVWPNGRRLTVDPSAPHIYGVHEDHDREMARLMRDQGVRGHILWTEAVGHDPADPGGGKDYGETTAAFGHTALVRLNNDYEPGGTIPHSSQYADFARRCADWVRRSSGCHIWLVGNEPNNPREHPPDEQITASRFARCFNLVYRAIKEVQPQAVVVPGAIDPTNAAMGDCRQYFREVLDGVDALDGIALHAYTHGSDPRYIVSDRKFTDEPLTWQFYHFRMFETFMEAIPESLRHLPVYLTETNHLYKSAPGDWGWVNQNKGWVWAMFQRVDEWNRRGGQQICCALLYRYPAIDRWVIRGKGEVIEDFRQSMGLKVRPYIW